LSADPNETPTLEFSVELKGQTKSQKLKAELPSPFQSTRAFIFGELSSESSIEPPAEAITQELLTLTHEELTQLFEREAQREKLGSDCLSLEDREELWRARFQVISAQHQRAHREARQAQSMSLPHSPRAQKPSKARALRRQLVLQSSAKWLLIASLSMALHPGLWLSEATYEQLGSLGGLWLLTPWLLRGALKPLLPLGLISLGLLCFDHPLPAQWVVSVVSSEPQGGLTPLNSPDRVYLPVLILSLLASLSVMTGRALSAHADPNEARAISWLTGLCYALWGLALYVTSLSASINPQTPTTLLGSFALLVGFGLALAKDALSHDWRAVASAALLTCYVTLPLMEGAPPLYHFMTQLDAWCLQSLSALISP